MREEIISLSVTSVCEFEIYRSILNSLLILQIRGFDVLENAPFRKSVFDTQIPQKMISPENTSRNLNHEVGVGTFINKYN